MHNGLEANETILNTLLFKFLGANYGL